MLKVMQIILEHAVADCFEQEWLVKTNLKAKNGTQSSELKLLAMRHDCQTALVVRLDKKSVKEPMLLLMEDLRFYTRAYSTDVVWGVASNLYEWQIVRYS